MRQRNDAPTALYVQRADTPFTVMPDEIVDWPDLIVGLTVLPDDDSATKPKKTAIKAALPVEETP
jgi:hypothetical protein